MAPYNPPYGSVYTEVAIPEYVNAWRFMKNLYWLTEETGVHYMWVDIDRRVVEIWGADDTIPGAVKRTRHIISRIARRKLFVPTDLPEGIMFKSRVFTWRDNGFVHYKVVSGDADSVFEALVAKYPVNPYCTSRRPENVISRLSV